MPDPVISSLTRRASLAMLGVAGLALFAQPTSARGRNARRKRRKRTKARTACPNRCGPQVAQCEAAIGESCGARPEQCALFIACCSKLATCDFAAHVTCLSESELP